MLARALFRLSSNGDVLHTQTFPNRGEAESRRDGFMGIVQTPSGAIYATGFVGGEAPAPSEPQLAANPRQPGQPGQQPVDQGGSASSADAATASSSSKQRAGSSTSSARVGAQGGFGSSFHDKPMFLIGGGTAFLVKLALGASPSAPLTIAFEQNFTAKSGDGFEPSQGMRVLYDAHSDSLAVSISLSYGEQRPAPAEFGLASVGLDGTVPGSRVSPPSTAASLGLPRTPTL